MQSLLQARMPARAFPLHARFVAGVGLQSGARILRDTAARRLPLIAVMPTARTPPIYTSPQDAAQAFYQAFERATSTR